MKLQMFMALCIILLAAPAGLAQTPSAASAAAEQTALLKQLVTELRQLRSEVLQQAIAAQQAKVKQLESASQQAQSERRRLSEQEQAIQQEMVELEKHLASPGAVQEDVQGAAEALRAAHRQGLKRLQSKQPPIFEREAETAEQLGKEQQRLQELLKKAKQFKTEN